jgi:hypothetical protein
MKSNTTPVAMVSFSHKKALSHQPLQNSGNGAGVQVDDLCHFLS